MLLLRSASTPVAATVFCLSALSCLPAVTAGDHFLQFRVTKSRCCIEDHGYETRGKPETATVISAAGIDLPMSRRQFVIEDVAAGRIQLSGLTALAVNERELSLSGVLNYTGNANQFSGGHVEVLVEALAVSRDGNERGVVIGSETKPLWLPAGKPKPITLKMVCGAGPGNSLEKIERVRVYLTYRPGR